MTLHQRWQVRSMGCILGEFATKERAALWVELEIERRGLTLMVGALTYQVVAVNTRR